MKGWWLAESLSSAAPGWVYVSSYQKEWWKWCIRCCTCAGREKVRIAAFDFISWAKIEVGWENPRTKNQEPRDKRQEARAKRQEARTKKCSLRSWFSHLASTFQTPYWPNWCNSECLLGRSGHREIGDLGVHHKRHKGFLLESSSGCSPSWLQSLLDGWAGWNSANRSRCRTWSPSEKWGFHSPCRSRCLFPYWACRHRWRVFLFLFGAVPGRTRGPIGSATLLRIFGWNRFYSS